MKTTIDGSVLEGGQVARLEGSESSRSGRDSGCTHSLGTPTTVGGSRGVMSHDPPENQPTGKNCEDGSCENRDGSIHDHCTNNITIL